MIAYEPIWAIGTGRTATAEDANEVIKAIRDLVREDFVKQRIWSGSNMVVVSTPLILKN